jgi:hypothetical protein
VGVSCASLRQIGYHVLDHRNALHARPLVGGVCGLEERSTTTMTFRRLGTAAYVARGLTPLLGPLKPGTPLM